ncbi:hypothetical protein I4F81_004349 [Pyropia yezoensis]|uniref:Uncharacterized protein n=1 Tax=Pyropia yezoensis TaxID=2788 RepID=A0ACC3BUN6_PYRYE|nr:hypothetical protein I4F81_004349 [Neopyropia yezoensis]
MATTPFAYRFHSAIHTVHIVLLALQVVSVGLRLRELPTAETVIPAVETAVLALVAAAGGRLRYVAAPARAPHPARRRAYLFYVAIGTVYGLLNAATSVAVMVFAARAAVGGDIHTVATVVACIVGLIAILTILDCWLCRKLVTPAGEGGGGG